MRSDIVSALAAVTSSADTHASALLALGASVGCDMSEQANKALVAARNTVSAISRMVAEQERPKGPTVRIVVESRYSDKKREVSAELVRTTAAQAMLKYGYTDAEAYKIESGYRVARRSSFEDSYRIHPDDLAVCRAMKPGHNAVSKALDAIEKEPARG